MVGCAHGYMQCFHSFMEAWTHNKQMMTCLKSNRRVPAPMHTISASLHTQTHCTVTCLCIYSYRKQQRDKAHTRIYMPTIH